MKFDVTGDIHGQAGNLDTLLAKLAYAKGERLGIPPHGPQSVLCNDLIERGT